MKKRDLYWIIAILLGLLVLIFSIRLNDNDSVVNIISIAAGCTSIVLGIAAIVQSCYYNYLGKKIDDKISEKLKSINTDTELIKSILLEDLKNSMMKNNVSNEAVNRVMNDVNGALNRVLVKSSMNAYVIDARLEEIIKDNSTIFIGELLKIYMQKKNIDIVEATKRVSGGLNTLKESGHINIIEDKIIYLD